jgi:hypothetical protein
MEQLLQLCVVLAGSSLLLATQNFNEKETSECGQVKIVFQFLERKEEKSET